MCLSFSTWASQDGLSKKELNDILPWAKNMALDIEEMLERGKKLEDPEAEIFLKGKIENLLNGRFKSYSNLDAFKALEAGYKQYQFIINIPQHELYFLPQTKLFILKLSLIAAFHNFKIVEKIKKQKPYHFDELTKNIDHRHYLVTLILNVALISSRIQNQKYEYAYLRFAFGQILRGMFKSSRRTDLEYARMIKKIDNTIKAYPEKIKSISTLGDAVDEFEGLLKELKKFKFVSEGESYILSESEG